jgi:hypothetical protein
MFLASFFELPNDRITLRAGCVDRHQVVVMEIDAPRAYFPEQGDNVDW